MDEDKANDLITDYTKFVVKEYKKLSKNITKLREEIKNNQRSIKNYRTDKEFKKQKLNYYRDLIFVHHCEEHEIGLKNYRLLYTFAKNALHVLLEKHKELKKELKKNLDSLSRLTN